MTFQFGSWAERIWIVEVLIFLLSSLRALIHFPPVIGRARLLPSTDFPFQSVVLYINSPLRFFFLFLLLFSPTTFSLMRAAPMETRERESECAQRGWLIHFPTSLFSISTCLLLSVSGMGLETSKPNRRKRRRRRKEEKETLRTGGAKKDQRRLFDPEELTVVDVPSPYWFYYDAICLIFTSCCIQFRRPPSF